MSEPAPPEIEAAAPREAVAWAPTFAAARARACSAAVARASSCRSCAAVARAVARDPERWWTRAVAAARADRAAVSRWAWWRQPMEKTAALTSPPQRKASPMKSHVERGRVRRRDPSVA